MWGISPLIINTQFQRLIHIYFQIIIMNQHVGRKIALTDITN